MDVNKKVCQKCKQEKIADDFCKKKSTEDGLNPWCKDCVNYYVRERKKDPEYREKQRGYCRKHENKTEVKQKRREDRKIREQKPEHREKRKNCEKTRMSDPQEREKKKNYNKKRGEDPAIKEKKREYDKEYNSRRDVKDRNNLRLKTDPLYKTKKNIRILIRKSLADLDFTKKTKSTNILGCDYDFLLMHLIITAEKRYGFYDENSKYEIDHILPLSVAKTEEDINILNHYSNLQFLTKHDNASKGHFVSEKVLEMDVFSKLSKDTQDYIIEKIKRA